MGLLWEYGGYIKSEIRSKDSKVGVGCFVSELSDYMWKEFGFFCCFFRVRKAFF